MKKYIYFVSFAYRTGDENIGVGNAEIHCKSKIKTLQDIQDIEKWQKEECKCDEIVITNWQLLRIEQ